MRRTENLENAIYHRKYKDIYKLIFNADIDTISDYSNWMREGQKNYVEIKRPLWIVMESKIINKRIWITHDFGNLSISIAQLDLDVNSSAYHDSHKWYQFNTQSELCDKLKEILEPCLTKYNEEQNLAKEQDLEYEKD